MDTTCATGELPIHMSRGLRIFVSNSTALTVNLGRDTSFCRNDVLTLILDAGNSGAAASYAWSTGHNTRIADVSSFVRSIQVFSSSYVWAEASNSSGCKTRDSIRISISDRPVIAALNAVPVGSGGLQYSFSETAPGAASYNWSFGVSGATGAASSMVYTYPAPGTYTIRLIVKNSCGADTAYKTITAGSTNNISNAANKDEVRHLPEPCIAKHYDKPCTGKH